MATTILRRGEGIVQAMRRMREERPFGGRPRGRATSQLLPFSYTVLELAWKE